MLFMLKDIRVKNKKIKVVKNHDKSKLNEDIDVVKAKARKTCMSYNYVFLISSYYSQEKSHSKYFIDRYY